eukprot:COSAG06_NODE_27254_length_596_cov_60.492958_2_plen_86_part_00
MKIYGIYMVYKKRHFLRHLYMKMIIFPSQALDNDRQRHTLKTKALFFAQESARGAASTASARALASYVGMDLQVRKQHLFCDATL